MSLKNFLLAAVIIVLILIILHKLEIINLTSIYESITGKLPDQVKKDDTVDPTLEPTVVPAVQATAAGTDTGAGSGTGGSGSVVQPPPEPPVQVTPPPPVQPPPEPPVQVTPPPPAVIMPEYSWVDEIPELGSRVFSDPSADGGIYVCKALSGIGNYEQPGKIWGNATGRFCKVANNTNEIHAENGVKYLKRNPAYNPVWTVSTADNYKNAVKVDPANPYQGVCRASINGVMHPGKLVYFDKLDINNVDNKCYVPWGGREHIKPLGQYEILQM